MDAKAVLEILVGAGVTKGARVCVTYARPDGEERAFEGRLEGTFLNKWKQPCFTMSQPRRADGSRYHRTFNPALGNVVSVRVLDPDPDHHQAG